MAAPVVKRWWQPGRLEQLPTILHQAFNTMLEGRRGPVLIDLAQDLQAELRRVGPARATQAPCLGPAVGESRGRSPEPPPLLAAAERPVILAGGGVIQAGATDAFVQIAEHLGAPVTTTVQRQGRYPRGP